ncbi:hypothetical protein JL101_016010 [Skermanella rosea]|uniref:hypothetical protein n=1 Tax=Skermanella rosea TaxID=1817965 RepID=UPI001934B2E5|nr:hypothetical protein [Skermanella rosea]UEM01512.1 hypothetical protein JL101_016010 [Skermanella rosea]
MERSASEDLIRTVVCAYARAKSMLPHPDAGYRAAIEILLKHNRRLTPEEAADRLIAMLCYAAEERPEWLQVEQPVAGAFLSRPPSDRIADP